MKLFVATPMYGGQCYGAYCDSMMRFAALVVAKGESFRFYPIFNESHIDRARSICVDEFLRSDCTHLMFIDSDIQFLPHDVYALVEADREVVCGFYPKKGINWTAIRKAVLLGYGEDDPNELALFGGDMVYTPALTKEATEFRSVNELVELHEGGSGFMLIRREVFEKLRDLHPELTCMKTGPGSGEITFFFSSGIDPDPGSLRHFLSEDYAFCRLVRNAGMKVWLAPWIKLAHHGYYQFQGRVEYMAALQSDPQKEAAE
jgi:hypothetical protein